MAGRMDAPASGRGPLLYGLIAIVVGVAGAIVLGLMVGGGPSPATASGSPPISALGSPVPSTIGSTLASPSGPDQSPLASDAAQPSSTLPPPTPNATPNATPKATPRPTPTPNTNPMIKSLTVPKTEDCTGGSAGMIHISWTVANATGVTLSIDGPGIFDTYPGTSGAVDVPYGCSHTKLSHTYTIATTGGSGSSARITRTVTTSRAQLRSISFGSPVCPAQGGIVNISFAYEIAAATGIELDYHDAGVTTYSPYGTYAGKTSSNGLTVQFNCDKGPRTYRLTTTGGYGPPVVAHRGVRRSP